MKTAKELYEEWKNTDDVLSMRVETLSLLDGRLGKGIKTLSEAINNERETAFIAGYDLAIEEIAKYLEESLDKQDMEQAKN